ncbi:MAG: hypothetical protein LIO46_06525, partial [Clostridiales bacterium]|nr:hypothetical protein [Clostridiales bacterium]
MSTGLTIFIIIQFLVSVLLIWGYAHEDQVIDFEDRMLGRIHDSHAKRTQEKHAHHPRHTQK